MKPVFMKYIRGMAVAMSLLLVHPSEVKAQEPQASTTPMDEKARQRAEREAKKAAEQEEKLLKAAAEKERRDAEAAAKEREKATARLVAAEQKSKDSGPEQRSAVPDKPAPAATPAETPTREQERVQKAEEKARLEAEKARQKEEDRIRAQEAKDAERRRKDEERAGREAQKAREAEDKARAAALKKEQEEAERASRRAREAGSEGTTSTVPPQPAAPASSAAREFAATPSGEPLSKDEEKRRRELVRQIEKARAERDRLTGEADDAERIARAARAAANEGQRAYEALATGLDVEDVSPTTAVGGTPETPRRNRFVTKADEKQAAAARNAPPVAADPLRIALDLKNPEPEVREKAAFALATLGPEAQPATRALMAALTDANPAVRVAAAQALGRIGTGASAAFAPLTAALTDPDPAVRNAAQAALLSIQGR